MKETASATNEKFSESKLSACLGLLFTEKPSSFRLGALAISKDDFSVGRPESCHNRTVPEITKSRNRRCGNDGRSSRRGGRPNGSDGRPCFALGTMETAKERKSSVLPRQTPQFRRKGSHFRRFAPKRKEPRTVRRAFSSRFRVRFGSSEACGSSPSVRPRSVRRSGFIPEATAPLPLLPPVPLPLA